MPGPQPTASAAPPSAPTPATPPAFFVNQQMTPATKNISESPVLSTPQTSGAGGSSAQKPKGPSRKKLIYGIGGAVLVLLLIAGGAGVYLTQTQQDNRQQASTPTGTARITISPPSGILKGEVTQNVPLSLELSTTPVSLSELTFVIAMTGQIPADMQFQPETLNGFSPADVSLTDSESGKTLSVSYKVPSGGTFTASTGKVNVGTLTFTNPNSGQLVLRFQASDSKALVKQSGADILRPPSLITYTFQSAASPTPITNEIVSEASGAGAIASSSSNSVASNSALAANSLAGAGGGTGGTTATATPTRTPTPNLTTTATRTPTPTVSSLTTTLTPTPTSSRSSSLPAETQQKPVSGSASNTFTLVGLGVAFIGIGVRLFRQKPKLESSEE
jgi:hypothetical protein